jgi:hypothetical protein
MEEALMDARRDPDNLLQKWGRLDDAEAAHRRATEFMKWLEPTGS